MKNVLIISFFLIVNLLYSQFSKIHYLPPIATNSTQLVQDQYIYISSPSTTNVNFTAKFTNGDIAFSGIVSRDVPFVYRIGTGDNTPMLVSNTNINQVLNNKGYIIEADNSIYVCMRLTANVDSIQAGSIVSKGVASPGKRFRIGAFKNTGIQTTNNRYFTFATILALENNTLINFADIKTGVVLINNAGVGNNPASIILNQGESYAIAVEGPTTANKDGLIGTLINSTKNIVVNCGSFVGSSGNILNNVDIGMDQIVSAEMTGTEYIFIRGGGNNSIERPMIVADQPNTEVFLNGSNLAITTLQPGQYLALSGTDFSPITKNLYVRTSEKVFAYQGIGGTISDVNQNMHFVPPLNCATPKSINNIPLINEIGALNNFIATICLVTKTSSVLDFIVNGTNYSLLNLASQPGIEISGPNAVSGNSDFVTYTLSGLKGNISAFSTSSLYLSYYGSTGAATYGGFYSGFTFNPEITFNNTSTTQSGCIPSINLEVKTISSFDSFDWFKNGISTGISSGIYQPTTPGYYYGKGIINACPADKIFKSDEIPVSNCAPDSDSDTINDNIDIDLDNDGVKNCDESFGNITINTANLTTGNILLQTYSNSFTGTISDSGTGIPVGNAIGDSEGIVLQVPVGKKNKVKYTMSFDKPISVAIQYPNIINTSDLINSNSNFIANCEINKTLTVLNPSNQLLIDTNYDGIYESNVTRFSSFEIRFRLNSAIPLAAGTDTFSFNANLVTSIAITQENLSEAEIGKSAFSIIATCVPRDNDGDGKIDQLDLDSDNDGILDNVELVNQNNIIKSNLDINFDGLDDAYTTINPTDFDNDGVLNLYDIDSDNDGIYDLIESGSTAIDLDLNGIVDGNNFGTNGFSNSLENVLDSGIANYSIKNTDLLDNPNYLDLDSDDDDCFDVIEAGFLDQNLDGFLGNNPINNDANGKVTSDVGYINPEINYLLAGKISISLQPINFETCTLENATFSVNTSIVNSYQWQVSTNNGLIFTDITDGSLYAGATTNTLSLNSIPNNFDNNKYRVYLSKANNTCGKYSDVVNLKVNLLPILTIKTLIQCDDNSDGITVFNLTEKQNLISINAITEKFKFFKTQAGADNNSIDPLVLIENPLTFTTGNATIWVRVTNINNCFSVIQLNLIVSSPPVNLATYSKIISECDDNLDENGVLNPLSIYNDGFTNFDFSTVVSEINLLLTNPVGYTIKFYKNKADALQENDVLGNSLAISNIANYRNIGYANVQKIWVRVDNVLNNDCFGFGDYLTLKVNPLPKIKLEDDYQICLNLPDISQTLTAGIIDGSSENDYSYVWTKDGINLLNNKSTLDVIESGIYSVTVKNKITECLIIRNMTVKSSETAIFLPPTIQDLVENPIVTINVSGIGDYEFSLDEPNGPFQNSNIFENVSFGIHEIFVNDKKNCGIVQQTINIIGAPRFFTPNGDGFNDFWNIQGTTLSNNYNSKVIIFDRFGKLITKINTFDQGWDGKFNNQFLPATDYWFLVELEDGRTAKGHFSLKR